MGVAEWQPRMVRIIVKFELEKDEFTEYRHEDVLKVSKIEVFCPLSLVFRLKNQGLVQFLPFQQYLLLPVALALR